MVLEAEVLPVRNGCQSCQRQSIEEDVHVEVSKQVQLYVKTFANGANIA